MEGTKKTCYQNTVVEKAIADERPEQRIASLCQDFYRLGWVSGTGCGVSIREGDRVYMAPSAVQKERIAATDIFELDREGTVVRAPSGEFRLSACAPLFLHAFNLRDAGAVIHSHSIHAMLATLVFGSEFHVTHLEMIKGIRGAGYHDQLVVPIIENTAEECDLADTMADAIRKYPDSDAVLVRRHGVYVWGKDWKQAKTQAESYDYLFQAAVRMHEMGLSPATAPVSG